MSKTIYLTTPLYYVNAAPHIGHSYTTVAVDVMARFHRLNGRDVFFLTGTDEHGQKIKQAADAAGLPPQVFTDQAVAQFASLWKTLNITHDDFIRTTQERHVKTVQAVISRLHEAGRLKRTRYQGWYCTPCETFWSMEEMAGNKVIKGPVPCLTCARPVEEVTEEGWYLPLRENQSWLLQFLESHPKFVQPSVRRNELLGMLQQPLPEYLCITRPKQRVSWGIEVPFSTDHVVYVWVDALINYISALGYLSDPERFKQLWPAQIHFIGKDILRHHALYWPIMLHELGFSDDQMPQMVFAHGWWKIGEQKMSKSLGNIVNPTVVIGQMLKEQPYAADVYRYFLLREVPFGQDGHFSQEALFGRLEADLANDLGNLVHRTLSMIKRYFEGKIPGAAPIGCAQDDAKLKLAAQALPGQLSEAMEAVSFSTALEAIFRVTAQANRYIEQQAPWKLAKAGEQARLGTVLAMLAEVLRITAITLDPFMPSVAASIWSQLGLGENPRRLEDVQLWPGLKKGSSIGEAKVLFPKAQRDRS